MTIEQALTWVERGLAEELERRQDGEHIYYLRVRHRDRRLVNLAAELGKPETDIGWSTTTMWSHPTEPHRSSLMCTAGAIGADFEMHRGVLVIIAGDQRITVPPDDPTPNVEYFDRAVSALGAAVHG